MTPVQYLTLQIRGGVTPERVSNCFSFAEYEDLAVEAYLKDDPDNVVIAYKEKADCWTRERLEVLLSDNQFFRCAPTGFPEDRSQTFVEIAGTQRFLVPKEDLDNLLDSDSQ